MKRFIALTLAVLLCAALFAACKKTPAAPGGTTAQPGASAAAPGATGLDGKPVTTEADHRTEPPGLKNYSSPKRIPTVKQGEDYSNGAIPDGVAEIFSVDGKLLFTYVTRWVGDKDTRTTRDFYTLFEYNAEKGDCRAVSPEVGYIMRVGSRFLYDKEGVDVSAANYWEVPYFTNNSAWTDEVQITGAEARKLISAPAQALIQGKMQPYTVQRSGASVTVTLPESGEVLAFDLKPKNVFGKNSIDGLIIDIRGAADEKLWISIGAAAEGGNLEKELFSMPVSGGALSPVRWEANAIWVDPIGTLQDGVIYGYSVLADGSRALLRVVTSTGKVQHLATVKDSPWHCVANGTHVLYEVPKRDGQETLACKKIETN